MESTYEKLKQFIIDYCADYCKYANDAETIHKMDRFWTEDFKAVAYFRRSGGDYPIVYPSRKDFQEFLVKTHIVIKDALKPVDFIIDERTKKIVTILKIIKTNKNTGEEIEIDGMGCYQIITLKDETFKITRLDFIWDAPEAIRNLGK
ncbi:MAG TPA: hypothetical protein VK186_13480 [Candidatus Deferrimicrobium sp.]|nr:hypothetical protein [Candidatus Kapabacteria bacterium]HLP59845.1 hypothetical protein [Candidatus Deferrimicrobium sp.]